MSDCLNCSEYNKEKHFCPKWCDVIKSTIEDARADEKIKLLDKAAEKIKIRLMDNLGLEDATKYGNESAKQQANSYATVMKYEIADCVDDLLDDLAEMKTEIERKDRTNNE